MKTYTQKHSILKACLEQAQTYRKELIAYHPFPTIAERKDWEALDASLKLELLQEGELALSRPFPIILATDFLSFSRTGDRQTFEALYFERRYLLNSLVLAECVENQGRFLDGIINGIFLLCEETSWVLPAHNSYTRDTEQLPLPDASAPVLDLFACETGATLAMVFYLLKDSLDRVSPLICQRIQTELQTRILKPYLHTHFWWMGNFSESLCNWTPWCTQNVLLTTFLVPAITSKQEKKDLFEKAAASLDDFLKDYGEDGCCDEGAQYYKHAGLCLFGALDLLNAITDHHFDSIFTLTKIKNIAAYISIVHIDGPYYFNFADCSPRAGATGVREYLFGKATKQQFLMDLAATDFQKSFVAKNWLLDESLKLNLFYRTQTVAFCKEILMAASSVEKLSPPPNMFYESVGLWITRNQDFALAVKAGDNDDSHNHNDVGSLILYHLGKPILVDIGVETYTKKTFSKDRYEIWTMQSAYHNVPTIAGKDQLAGARHKATDVVYSLKETTKTINMQLEKAYDELPENISYHRSVSFDTIKNQISITDTTNSSDILLHFITYEKPVIKEQGVQIGDVILSFSFDNEVFTDLKDRISYEVLPIRDARLQTAWDHDLYRILVKGNQSSTITILPL